jgi:hypothetical protein
MVMADCSLTFINMSNDADVRGIGVFIDPIGGHGIYVSGLKSGTPRTVPYPESLGPKILVSFSIGSMLFFGDMFDLTGITSCDLVVTVTGGTPEVAIRNEVRA